VKFQYKDAIYIIIILVLLTREVPSPRVERYYYKDTFYRDSIIRQNYTKQIHEIETIYDTIRIDGSINTTQWLLAIHRHLDTGGQLSTFTGRRMQGKDTSLSKIIEAR